MTSLYLGTSYLACLQENGSGQIKLKTQMLICILIGTVFSFICHLIPLHNNINLDWLHNYTCPIVMCLLDMKFNFITILIAESVFYLKKRQ